MARGNFAVIFGALVAGAVIIDYGAKNVRATFANATATSPDPTGGPSPSAAAVPGNTGPVAGTVVATTTWNPSHKPVAAWIAPVLQWASTHGWKGIVTSGYRSFAEQAAINARGLFSAKAGSSNHESTTYPGGAVDVTDPAGLTQVLKGYTGPFKLIGGVLGASDPEHFSANGH